MTSAFTQAWAKLHREIAFLSQNAARVNSPSFVFTLASVNDKNDFVAVLRVKCRPQWSSHLGIEKFFLVRTLHKNVFIFATAEQKHTFFSVEKCFFLLESIFLI